VSGTGCVATSGTPKLLMTLMRYHPNGSSDSVAVKPLPLRPDGRWSGTLVVPVRTPPSSYQLEAHCVVGGVGAVNDSAEFRVTSAGS
jgi:hypothetical protein